MAEYTTNNGRPITFKKVWDFEPPNRGWVVHALLAEVDGDPAGYIKVSYIPKENFEREFPDVFHYVAKMKGWTALKYALAEDNLDARIKAMDYYGGYYSLDLAEKSLEERLEMVKKLEARIKYQYQKEYKGFKEFHMDKPLVDFIRVYDEHDTYAFTGRDERMQLTKKINFKRQGVASALYKEAALWLNELKLKLHASGLQQPEAKAAWDKMKDLGLVDEVPSKSKTKPYAKTRFVLNTDAFSMEP